MKYEVYEYKEQDVEIKFQFPIGENNIAQKKKFLKTLKMAIYDLELELNQHIDPKSKKV